MPPVLDPKIAHKTSVYGPVKSWRVGNSLGIDLLLQTSTCSFNCIYCQLGDIQQKTIERQIYVSTDQLERDFKESAWESADIITFSGSGEPTLALNMAEVIRFIKDYTYDEKPVMVLTNGTTLQDPAVQKDLMEADTVSVKLDAATDEILQRMNRPVPGITLDSILQGIRDFRKIYPGKLTLQCMFMPSNIDAAEAIAKVVGPLDVDEVQLNTPKRPYPLQWVLD
nr:radical SAM protein [Vampirovibrio sp.]